jgi:hypothetical protein
MGSEKTWIGAALDIFFGFGIGNFYQKDYLGGGIALGGDLAGLGLFIGGYAVMINGIATEGLLVGFLVGMYTALPLAVCGSVVLTASRIFGLVRTLIFPPGYNNKLKNALNIRSVVMNIEPSLNITGSEYELTLVHFRY